jgi:hypothetical protein
MLDRGFGAGFIWSKGEFLPGAHQAVISEQEWLAYRVKRDERSARATGGPNKGDIAVYSSLLRCHCGAKMDGGSVKRNGQTYRRYTCRDGLTKGGHSKVSVSESYVEEAVLGWLESVAAQIDAFASTLERPKPENTGRKAKQLSIDLQKNIARTDSLAIKYIDGDIPTDSYKRLLESLGDEKRALEARLRLVEVNSEVKPAAIVPQLLEAWPTLPDRGKRDILSKLVARIQLHDWEFQAKVGRRRLEVIEHDWE